MEKIRDYSPVGYLGNLTRGFVDYYIDDDTNTILNMEKGLLRIFCYKEDIYRLQPFTISSPLKYLKATRLRRFIRRITFSLVPCFGGM